MSDRIDHAAEARAIVAEGAGGIHNQQMVLAQVHATLALVDQQRIANRLKAAELDLLDEIGGNLVDVALMFRIRPYLTRDDWALIKVSDADVEASEADGAFS